MNRRTLSLIFSGIGVAGVGITSFIAGRRSFKYKEILEKNDNSKAKAAVKTYWPAFVSGILTVGSIVAAEGINLKEIGILTGAVTYLVSQRDKIIGAVEEVSDKLSDEDKKKLHDAIAETNDKKMEEKITYIVKAGPSVEDTGRGDLLCFEGTMGRWFRSSEESVARAIEEFRELHKQGHDVCFNTLYDLNGMETTWQGYIWCFPSFKGSTFDVSDEIDIGYTIYDDFNAGGNMHFDEPVLEIIIRTHAMERYDDEPGRYSI